MKRELLIASICMLGLSAWAQTKTYTDDLIVSVNGQSISPQSTTVLVEYNEDGTINFNLKNFMLVEEGNEIPVGNIFVEKLKLTPEDNTQSFVYDDDLQITPGDMEGMSEGEWYGPVIGPIPLNLSGKMNDDKLYVVIDIDLDGLQVHVTFGSDDFPTGIKKVENSRQNEAIYDLSGRRVSNPTKGIYIVNGKKVLR